METTFLTDMHTDCFCLKEPTIVVSCPLLKFIQTKLQLTFNDTHVGPSVASLKIIDIQRAINSRFQTLDNDANFHRK